MQFLFCLKKCLKIVRNYITSIMQKRYVKGEGFHFVSYTGNMRHSVWLSLQYLWETYRACVPRFPYVNTISLKRITTYCNQVVYSYIIYIFPTKHNLNNWEKATYISLEKEKKAVSFVWKVMSRCPFLYIDFLGVWNGKWFLLRVISCFVVKFFHEKSVV